MNAPNRDKTAFPSQSAYAPGLSKREFFALAAMQGMCANSGLPVLDSKRIASFAIQTADVLLEKLEENVRE